ncbi:unnamed protein product [Leptosia nina]|uniref:Cuticle protein n=1 Tax=Leptosia nina TaxID=320188 RepID=A0AAV1J1K2_9NEOP
MAAKFFAVLALAAVASALPVVPLAKVAYEAEAPAHYEFQYSVHDEHTGDIKQQQESRAGDAVHGSYSLVQPDGVHRIVEYTSDHENGFNANVRYEGTPIPAPAPAKVAYAAPIAKVAYAAPVAKVAYAAPVAKVAYAAPVSYAAPVAHYSAPVAHYSAPVAHYSAPVAHYSAPVAQYAAPVAKVAYSAAPALTQVTFSSPAVSYHH